MFYLCLLLLISTVAIDYPDNNAAWPLGIDVPPRRGYGQYNGDIDFADFHRALDFHGSLGAKVFAPYPGEDFWVIDRWPEADTITETRAEGHVIIGTSENADYGWVYGHIDIDHDRFDLFPEVQYNRSVISVLEEHPLGSHVHFSWLDAGALSPGVPQHGYFNPIDYLIRIWGLFNVAAFNPTHPGPFQAFESITGIIFAYEGVQNVIPEPQTRVREVIDIIVRPYTYYYQNPTNDSCAVRKVIWRLVWQNPSTLEYQPYTHYLLGVWRTLYDFSGYIFDDALVEPLDEYEKIFFGGMLHWSNNICLTNTCETPRSDASFPGVETVWIEPYDRLSDYTDDEFCRGGWDTRLSVIFDGEPANIDEAAAFIDGRYAIDVVAFPQRLDNRTFIRLPVDTITLPEPEVTGIIVDNWAPRIVDICLKDSEWQIIRFGTYVANEPNNQYAGRRLSYNYPGYFTYPYIGTGVGTNEYSLEISYSEPVTSLTPNISVTIKMITGPDSTENWIDVLGFELDASCYNANGECTVAEYYASGDQPPGYVGKQIVEMTINSSFATDLAGNGLDADALTIVPALGEGGSEYYENTFDFIVDDNFFDGYERSGSSEHDSRSRDIYAYYDRVNTPLDDSESEEWIKHEISLTGALYYADLFNEVNWMHIGRNTCSIYGGAWMCDDVEDVLHLYIVDYQGIIVQDEIIFDPGTSDTSADIQASRVTSRSGLDRYGWLGWGTITPVPEDNRREDIESNIREDINLSDVELNYTVCDAYTGVVEADTIVTGHEWYNTVEQKWYRTLITGMQYVAGGGVEITTYEHHYPIITPQHNRYIYYPPEEESYNSVDSDSLFDTGITSRGIEINDYFSVFPNPARESVSIDFMTSGAVGSTVRIYDISGHLVRIIAKDVPGMRNHNLIWDLKDANGHIVPTGIYYVSLVSGSLMETRTVIVSH